jgi:general stress protein 26
MLAGSEDLSLRCATFLSARKVDHIRKNPEVHITCGVTDPRKVDAYLQIAGHGDVVNERVQKMAFWNETLETVFKGPDDPDYGLVVVRPHRIELWKPGGRTPEVWES